MPGLRWADHIVRMEESKVLTGTPTGKRPIGRPRRRWENNIKEVGINTRNWVDSA